MCLLYCRVGFDWTITIICKQGVYLLFDGLFFKHYNLSRVISMFILLSDLNYQNLATGLTNDTTTLFVCSKSVVWLQCMNLINNKSFDSWRLNTICVRTTKHWRYYLTSTRTMSFRCNITFPHATKPLLKTRFTKITFWWILYCLNSCCSWFFLLWHDSWWWSTNKTFFYFRFHKFSTNQKCNCRSDELIISCWVGMDRNVE